MSFIIFILFYLFYLLILFYYVVRRVFVRCVIVVPLPQGNTPFAIQISDNKNNNNNNNIKINNIVTTMFYIHYNYSSYMVPL
jgi:hypothetical protein